LVGDLDLITEIFLVDGDSLTGEGINFLEGDLALTGASIVA
jgi:hypothetical protein